MKSRTCSIVKLVLLASLCQLASLQAYAQQGVDVFEASIVTLQEALERGQVTSVNLIDQYLARIEAYDKQGPALNSIIRVNDQARAQAQALDEERARSGSRGPLHGIPFLVKDNYNTTTMPTTGGSVALADFIPSENATQIDLLLDAGAIIVAKTNLHEYAYGITSISSLLGQTRNPYDYRRVPGGSSGGTGAAVAASFGAFGLGSDTCGSIRIPSAFNNLIGLRPTKGFSSIYGVMPLSHTQDVAGPLTRSAEDLAIVLDVVGGYDANDAATEIMQDRALPAFQQNLNSVDPGELRIGQLVSYLDRADGATQRVIDEALQWYQEQGAEIIEIEIPDLGELIAASGLISHEFRSDLNAYLSLFQSKKVLNLNDIVSRGLYHEAVNGALTRSNDSVFNQQAYAAAVLARDDLRSRVEQVLAESNLDILVYPPIAELPVFTGEPQPGNNCSISANSGLPALSMPVGFSNNGLPVGMELLGRQFDDARLLAIAHAYESANDPRKPPAVTPALIDGAAPEPITSDLSFSVDGVVLEGDFTFDVVRNELRYDVRVAADNSAEIYAVTLLVDREEGLELNDPIVLNLMGPDMDSSAGSYFMSPQFRQAFVDRRVYLKVFGSTLFASGVAQRLR